MHKLEVIIDETSGVPTAITAKGVVWNDPDWDLVSPANEIVLTKSSNLSGNLYWYYGNIEDSGNYSIFLNDGSTDEVIEGYEGKYIQTGDIVTAVTQNTAHANLVTGNPHAVTKTELSLGNVENYAAVDQCGEMTKAQIIATGLDVADLPDTAEGKFITVANILAGMVDGSANANTLLDFIGTRLGANALFAKMSSEVLFVSSGTAAANTITPKKIGAIYVKTDDSYVYVSKGLTTSDWIDIT